MVLICSVCDIIQSRQQNSLIFKFPKLKFLETSIFRVFLFFFKVQKIKYFHYLLSNHRNFFSESSYGKVTEMEKHRFWLIYLKTFKKLTFLGPVTSILTFCNFLKHAPEYIDPSGHFVFYEIFCSSNF